MKKFLIQIIDGMVKHDFSFHLMEAVRYQNWFYNENVCDYLLSDSPVKGDGFIPIGSLEFVFQYLETYYGVEKEGLKPINIPLELMDEKYTKRKVFRTEKKDMILTKEMFVKSDDEYKTFTEVTDKVEHIPNGSYLLSDVVNIESEWRTFVHMGKMVGLQCYSGDFTLFPNVNAIEEMIAAYKESPRSYTLDVGVNDEGTFIIEVHPFVSCGLYGFSDYRILPNMFEQGILFLLKNKK